MSEFPSIYALSRLTALYSALKVTTTLDDLSALVRASAVLPPHDTLPCDPPDDAPAAPPFSIGASNWARGVPAPTSMPSWHASNISDDWRRAFYDTDLRLDPVFRLSLTSTAPIDWDEIYRDDPANDVYRAHHRAYGLGRYGVSASARGQDGSLTLVYAAFDFSPEDWATQHDMLTCSLQIIAAQLNQKLQDLKPKRTGLTQRESQCLMLASLGKRGKEVAYVLGVSKQTVDFHLSRARAKLGASSTMEAFAIASECGMLKDVVVNDLPLCRPTHPITI